MKTVKITHCKYDLKFDYYVNENGSIYSDISKKILSWQLDKDGYAKVQMMSTDGKRHRYSVHRLVLENFCPREDMDQLQVNHIDGNKLNNRLDNLEWCTCSENHLHAHRMGLKNQTGEKNNASKLSDEDVKAIIELLLTKKYTYKQILEKLNLTHVHEDIVGVIKRKKRWCHLTENIDFN